MPLLYVLSWTSLRSNYVNIDLSANSSHFCYYLPLEMTNGHHLNKSESPSPKDDLGQVWLKLAQWFWRRRFLKLFHIFLHIRYYLPLEMTNGHHMNKSESPSPKDDLDQA